MNKIVAGALTLVFVLPAAAAEKFDAEARAKAVVPFLDELTFAVVHLDLSRIDVNALAAKDYLFELSGLGPEEIEEPKRELRTSLAAFTKAGGKDLYWVFSLADLPNAPFVVVPLPAGADPQVLRREMEHNKLFLGQRFETVGRAIVGGQEDTLKRVRSLKPTLRPKLSSVPGVEGPAIAWSEEFPPRPELAKAFAAAGDTTAQIVVLPTADMRRTFEEIVPTLPPELGGGPSKPFTRGFQWGVLGVDAPPKMGLRLMIQSPSPKAAKGLQDLLAGIFKGIGQQKEVRQALPEFDKVAALFTPKVVDDRLILSLDDRQLTTVLQPLLVRVRADAARTRSSNNLRQLVLALHNYNDTHKAFPAQANFDRQGKPLLSWRVHILPYIEQEALYKEFHLDEPWDSEHNKKLIARMPAVYRSPLSRGVGAAKTTYLAPVGAQTMFTGGPKGLTIADVTDGTSNTIFLIEADDDHAVIWTKPEDLKYDPKQASAGLRNSEGTFQAAFVDGSVHLLPATIDAKTLQALFTRNGGEVVKVP
jgi:hypothetical protein